MVIVRQLDKQLTERAGLRHEWRHRTAEVRRYLRRWCRQTFRASGAQRKRVLRFPATELPLPRRYGRLIAFSQCPGDKTPPEAWRSHAEPHPHHLRDRGAGRRVSNRLLERIRNYRRLSARDGGHVNVEFVRQQFLGLLGPCCASEGKTRRCAQDLPAGR
jgi:hypothetical protein